MKNKIAVTLKKGSRSFGYVLGTLFSVFPRSIRKGISRLCAFMSHHVPHAVHFLVYELVTGIGERLYRRADSPVFMERTLSGGFRMRLDITKMAQRQVYLNTVFEPHVTSYIQTHLTKGNIFLDVGANVGYYTYMASVLVGEAGTVIAFEPERENFERLAYNATLNNTHNVTCVNKAVGETSGHATLHINPFNEGGHSIETLQLDGVLEEQRIEVLTLDAYFKSVPHPNRPCLMKMDVEGHELHVLLGMRELLRVHPSFEIICEVSRNKKEIFELLAEYGYKVFSLEEGRGEVTVTSDTRKRDYLFKKPS